MRYFILMKIIYGNPRGFCGGVNRAMKIVEAEIQKKSLIFINHEIVHNKFLIKKLEKQGVKFESNPDKVPKNAVYIFSAHGVSLQFREKVKKIGLQTIDATCPLVQKTHDIASKYLDDGYKIIFIGKKNHQETVGIKGVGEMKIIENLEDAKKIVDEDFYGKMVVLTQTTISYSDTEEITNFLKTMPNVKIKNCICNATQNRQKETIRLSKIVDFLIIIGSVNSSNSKRLFEIAKKNLKKNCVLAEDETVVDKIGKYEIVGIMASASAPEILVERVAERLKRV